MNSEIKNYNFKNGLTVEFEIGDLSDFYVRNKHRISTIHRVNFYQILLVTEGSSKIWVDFKPINLKPNSLLFLNKDVVKQFEDAPLKGKVILFTDNFYYQEKSDYTILRNHILFSDLYPTTNIELNEHLDIFELLFNQIQNELNTKKDHLRPSIIKSLLNTFLLQAERVKRLQNFSEAKPSEELDIVLKFKDELEKNYFNSKLVNFYSQKIHISDKKLNQSTQKILGKSPKQIIDERIILEAKRELASNNKSIKEIAYKLGFDEPTNFVKYFKKHLLISPTQFINKYVDS